MKDDRIPRATVKRLPLYYRHLNILSDQGKNRISSKDLSEIVKVDSATIRKDFLISVSWAERVTDMISRN